MPSHASARYVAFLRGINVGGNKKVSMQELKKTLESSGFTQVKTLLNSGNVVFEAEKEDTDALEKKIEKILEQKFGFAIPVLIRTVSDIQKLIDSDPFKSIQVTPETRLYVTFLSDVPTSTLKIPYESPQKDFKILQVADRAVCSVLIVSPTRKTPEVMGILEKEFGRRVTTRNWNTVKKLIVL